MASPNPSLLSCAFFLFSFTLSISSCLHVDASRSFSIDLVRRDSPRSPYYNPELTPTDRLRAAVRRSVHRARYVGTRQRSSFQNSIDAQSSFEAEVIPNSFDYLVKLGIGTPPVEVVVMADTGSDLTWVQCEPCVSCYKQIPPIFNPNESSTFDKVSCETESCHFLSGICKRDSSCHYNYRYGDGSNTHGDLAQETFTFGSGASVAELSFGCSYRSNGTWDEHGAGFVGLGGGRLSLITQLGTSINGKFSYCLVPYDENSTSTMHFGDGADVKGVTTPLVPRVPTTFYYLHLESITVGDDETIAVGSKKGGSRDQLDGNIIIDSGTTLTYLPSDTLTPLETAIEKKINLTRTEDPEGFFSLCYDYNDGGVSEKDFPDITFNFHEAPVVLKAMHTFVLASEGIVCLAFSPSDDFGMPIFGNVAQQNFHIGYDLQKKELSFAPTDCAKL